MKTMLGWSGAAADSAVNAVHKPIAKISRSFFIGLATRIGGRASIRRHRSVNEFFRQLDKMNRVSSDSSDRFAFARFCLWTAVRQTTLRGERRSCQQRDYIRRT